MLIPLQAPEIWDVINEEFRQSLGFKSENQIRTYANLYSAVEEITCQLTSFLAHKRNFTWVKGMSPTFDAPLAGFLRDGFQTQSVDWKILSQFAGQEAQWVEALPKDTLFVLAFVDHAVTGQRMKLDELEKTLNQKKIYFIKVSHFGLPSNTDEILPYTVHIGPSGYESLALAVCGARYRAPERGIPYHPWKKINFEIPRICLLENQTVIEKIENTFKDEKWFSNSDLRRYDRVVLSFKDLAGDKILETLQSKLQIKFTNSQAQTTHICHWNSVRLYKTWWSPMPSPEQLRGLVLFSLDIAQRSDFSQALTETVKELRQEAIWEA